MSYAMKHPIHPFHGLNDRSGSSSPSRHYARAGSDERPPRSTKTVVVLGASYGGARAARVLSQSLPEGWRVVVIDRNSHMNHVYVFPRFTVLPQHAPKGFIPYTNFLKPPSDAATPTDQPKSYIPTPPLTPNSSTSSLVGSGSDSDEPFTHTFIQASITSLTPHACTFIRPLLHRPPLSSYSSTASISTVATTGTYGHFDGPEEMIEFDYCVYALGSGMPDPVNVWEEHAGLPDGVAGDHAERGLGSKKGGVRWMERKAESLKRAGRVVIVGGGALGIQFATDLKAVYPEKEVTLLHSRTRLMPLYPIAMHVAIIDGLKKQGVNVVLGERVVTWPVEPEHLDGNVKILRTDKGRQFEADLVLPCTGQKPHSQLMAAMSPSTISASTSRLRVTPTLQVSTGVPKPPTSRANTAERLASLSLANPLPSSPPSSSTSTSASASSSSYHSSTTSEPDLSHMFAIGDCADTGAIQAGHTAYWQAEVAARNIMRLIKRRDGKGKEELEVYKAGPPAIKVSLGLTEAVTASGEEVTVSDDGVEDLKAMIMWPMLQAGDLEENA